MILRRYKNVPSHRKLTDVPLPSRRIDRGIANLVRAVVAIRVRTEASCEGHLDRKKHQHPWVAFNPFSFAKLQALQYLVAKYNKSHQLQWEVQTNWLVPPKSQRALCRGCGGSGIISSRQLGQLRRSADELAGFIFGHLNDRAIRESLLIYGL